ncbi:MULTISPECIES: GGDEF domain-containing protein [unclassified Pseudomonas]|uniref:GGDEF domain-containing protein n=1 Tax=unclassified Pseudomonas TaxID=196821 RepID=UPI000D6CC40E|nr:MULTISPECIES: GGDEF domain-containing protein [unclassified Pseudomonas]
MPFIALDNLQMVDALTWKWQMARNATHQTLCIELGNEAGAQAPLRISQRIKYDSLTELPHGALPGDRFTPSIFLSSRPDEQWAVMFLGLDRFHRINNVLGYPMSKDVDEPSVNPKRDGEPHEH